MQNICHILPSYKHIAHLNRKVGTEYNWAASFTSYWWSNQYQYYLETKIFKTNTQLVITKYKLILKIEESTLKIIPLYVKHAKNT